MTCACLCPSWLNGFQAARGESGLWGPHALTNLDGRLEMKQTHHRADIRTVAYGPQRCRATAM